MQNRRIGFRSLSLRLRSGQASVFCLRLSVLWLLLCGCQQQETVDLNSMSAEQKKVTLLAQLDRKFENPDAHFELGRLYQAEGQWAEAEYHYNVALGFDPAHRRAQAAMVKGLADGGSTAKAQQYAKAYMNQVASSATGSLELARAFDTEALDEYALACYQQALRIAPDSPEVNKQLGYYYLNGGDKTRAKEYLSRSFQLDPNQADVAGELGRLGVVVKIPGPAQPE